MKLLLYASLWFLHHLRYTPSYIYIYIYIWALHIVISKEVHVSPDELETQLCNYFDDILAMEQEAEATSPTVDHKEPEPCEPELRHRRQGDKDPMFLGGVVLVKPLTSAS